MTLCVAAADVESLSFLLFPIWMKKNSCSLSSNKPINFPLKLSGNKLKEKSSLFVFFFLSHLTQKMSEKVVKRSESVYTRE